MGEAMIEALCEWLDEVAEGLSRVPVGVWWALGGLAAFVWAVLS